MLSDLYIYHTSRFLSSPPSLASATHLSCGMSIEEERWHRLRPSPPLPSRAYHRTCIFKEYAYFIGGVDFTGHTVGDVIKYNLGL